VQKAAPTAGDRSQAAAAGNASEVNATFIPYETPGGLTVSEQLSPTVQTIGGATFLDPPEDPGSMYKMYQLSAYLTPVMDALETNVYKAPYQLKPVIPFDRPLEAHRIVRDALLWQKATSTSGAVDFDADVAVTDKEVEDLLKKLEVRAKVERHYLDRFFEEAVPDMSYRQLSGLTGQDYEITGNAYWEIIRDTSGHIARFQWLPSVSMRATKQDPEQIATTKIVRDSVLGWVKTAQIRRFRSYGQLRGNNASGEIISWFKEFGDPRVMSRVTGKYYRDLDALQEAEGDPRQDPPRVALPATEVMHFRLLFGGSSVYGKPRWAGAYVSLMGSRDLDEENQKIVGDEAVPSLMMMISGGVVGQKSYERLRKQIEERKKGRKGIMIVEAVASANSPVAPQLQPKIDIEKLKSEQQTDMLFQKYDSRNEDKTDSSWRLPKTVLGKAGANRAVSQSERQFAEDQIFAPLRADKDEPINNSILADHGIKCWRYETMSMQPRDPQQRAEILRILTEVGILTPNEGRELAADIFSKRLDDLQGLWTMFPPRVLTVLLQTKNAELAATLLGEDKEALAKLANTIRDNLGLGPDGAAAMTVPDADGELPPGGNGVKDARQPEGTGAQRGAGAVPGSKGP
jgi:capsid portal protein